MLKKQIKIGVFVLLLLIAFKSNAAEFNGLYVGAKAGVNESQINGAMDSGDKSAFTGGLQAGYNWLLIDKILLGLNGYYDSNGSSSHSNAAGSIDFGSNVYGLDAKVGWEYCAFLPYGKIGYARVEGTDGASSLKGDGLHGGLGVEYKFAQAWGVALEWTADLAKKDDSELRNDNFTLGLNYYFGAPAKTSAPNPMPARAPEPVQPPEPEVKSEPVPPPSPAVEAPQPVPPAPEPVNPLPEEAKPVTKTIHEDHTVLEGANFGTGSAKLLPAAYPQLDKVVEFAKQFTDARIEISGYTDNTGNAAANQKLSQRRAESVKAYLVSKGVTASQITALGYGSDKPIADNKTREGRARNRRVEVSSKVSEERTIQVNP